MPATTLKQASATSGDEPTSYERDFHAWTLEQAAALRARDWRGLDIPNLAEEIEDLGRTTFKELESAYRVILLHLLEWDHQPERRSRSWAASIETQRFSADDVLRENPGLKSRRADAVRNAYRKARVTAAVETKKDKSVFPAECPYSPDEIMNRPLEWPER